MSDQPQGHTPQPIVPGARFIIPQMDDVPMRWDYFLMEAARGSRRVPDWVLMALPCFVAEHRGIQPDEVEAQHIDEVLAALPADPKPTLRQLLKQADMPMPEPGGDPILDSALCQGNATRVRSPDLLYDAALLVCTNYGVAGFEAAVESLDSENWDPRQAVAAMLYLLLTRSI